MLYRIIFFLLIIAISVSTLFQANLPAETSSETQPMDFSEWFIENETSIWTPKERAIVETVLRNSMNALADAGLDGNTLLSGYRFERFAGEYANNKKGKIAIAYLNKGIILLSDSIFLPENIFYIYHELGHVIDFRSGHELDTQFHTLTLQIEGVTTKHDWTTAQGFFLRGHAHVHKIEATADAFALWVYVSYAGNPVPEFRHMPENGNPDAIIQVYEEAQKLVFKSEVSVTGTQE